MQKNSGSTLGNLIADRFSSDWKLLSETEAFLSHTPDFPAYEQQFTEWRAKLQNKSASETDLTGIRGDIIILRKTLRLKGYDLSLGLQRLVVKDFRNDDAIGEGFQRAVLVFCDPQIYYKTGTANHIDITEELLDSLGRQNLLHSAEVHYLWYRRDSKGLLLSGSATEQPSDFDRLQARAAANPLKLLSALKNLV